ncbi:hypothetical protein [Ruegeria sp. HKCCD8929]|uniref:hypothetical protein n=1 Tax=Ruegeria sp. HKCCD8929 TaxID=2683006 RepID=UPI0014897E4A|nr:hypothetical protein [Ruegeria sp. HKCCD8929]
MRQPLRSRFKQSSPSSRTYRWLFLRQLIWVVPLSGLIAALHLIYGVMRRLVDEGLTSWGEILASGAWPLIAMEFLVCVGVLLLICGSDRFLKSKREVRSAPNIDEVFATNTAPRAADRLSGVKTDADWHVFFRPLRWVVPMSGLIAAAHAIFGLFRAIVMQGWASWGEIITHKAWTLFAVEVLVAALTLLLLCDAIHFFKSKRTRRSIAGSDGGSS